MIPDQFNRYQILSELGRGGMATVFLALDPRMNRQVALKLLPPGLMLDPTFEERFDREVKIIAQLEHPAIIAGLPVFIVPWRQVQAEARESGALGLHARRSIPRKIYLYLFLFVAALVDLAALVFIIYRLLSSLLGGDRLVLVELAQAIGYAAIAAAIWVSHLLVLLGDRRLLAADERAEQASLRLVIVDLAESGFGQAVVVALADRNPDLVVDLVSGGGTESPGEEQENVLRDRLSAADLILGPWTIAQAGGETPEELARAVAASPARKLLVPTWQENWDWVGVDFWRGDGMIRQMVSAVQQAVAGRPITPRRSLGAAAIAWIVVGALILLSMAASLIIEVFST